MTAAPRLSRYMAHKLAGVCTYGSCSLAVIDGSSLCLQHGIREHRRARAGMADIRRQRRADGLCAACGKWKSASYYCAVCEPKKRPAPTTTVTTSAALCEICEQQPATVTDRVAERPFLMCVNCAAEEAEAPRPAEVAPRDRMLAALGRWGADGCEIAELCEALGEEGEAGLQRVSALVNRAVKAGLVTFRGHKNDRIYSVVRREPAR